MAISFQGSNTRNAFYYVTKPWNPQWYVGYRLCRAVDKKCTACQIL